VNPATAPVNQCGSDESSRPFQEPGKDDTAVDALLFLQFNGELVQVGKGNLDAIEKDEHKPCDDSPNERSRINHGIRNYPEISIPARARKESS